MNEIVKIDVIDAEIFSGEEIQMLGDYYFPGRARVQTTEQLVELWINSANIKSAQTKRVYCQIALDLCSWMRDRYSISDLRFCTLAHLQSYVVWLKEEKPVRGQKDRKGLSQNASAKYVAAIRSLWSFGTKESIGYFPCNAAAELAMEWEETLSQRILSEQQIWELEEAAGILSDRHLLLFQLIYYSGCQVGEIGETEATAGKKAESKPGLRWKQIREDGDCIIVTVTGKGSKTRSMRLDPETSAALLAVKGDASPDDPVFPSCSNRRKGRALTDRGIRALMAEVCEKAGIKFSPNWLRHAHATHALKRGAPTICVQKQLGHSSLAVTGKYVHVNPERGTGEYLRNR
ncbi:MULTISPECIES: tyrosine-type recombinase/integrase [Nostocales]|uniref:Tyrosine-type recombinase/integrase n=3 Tax=Nostocales TaxID=1161 RepID=A0A8S9T921_9CYAN|nr:tyrosine-type recombinase/integrase [Tolypothrix bouteillei]KAF3888122.1 tyrosine-type recombinase/integrase [Tolypothrix bouteillei VB521301]